LTAPGTSGLKLTYEKLLSTFAFKYNLRRYMLEVRRGISTSSLLKYAPSGRGYPEPFLTQNTP
jgi:hypothetical protein